MTKAITEITTEEVTRRRINSYATRANAAAAVEKRVWIPDNVEVILTITPNENGRFCPVLFFHGHGPDKIQAAINAAHNGFWSFA